MPRPLAAAVLACVFAAAARPAGAQLAPGLDAAAPVAPAVVTRDAAGHVSGRAVRTNHPLRIDGRLDEAENESTEAIGGFLQQEPAEGAPATERTEAWIFF